MNKKTGLVLLPLLAILTGCNNYGSEISAEEFASKKAAITTAQETATYDGISIDLHAKFVKGEDIAESKINGKIDFENKKIYTYSYMDLGGVKNTVEQWLGYNGETYYCFAKSTDGEGNVSKIYTTSTSTIYINLTFTTAKETLTLLTKNISFEAAATYTDSMTSEDDSIKYYSKGDNDVTIKASGSFDVKNGSTSYTGSGSLLFRWANNLPVEMKVESSSNTFTASCEMTIGYKVPTITLPSTDGYTFNS